MENRLYLIHYKKQEQTVILNQYNEKKKDYEKIYIYENCRVDTIISDRHLAYAIIDKSTDNMVFFIIKKKAYLLLEE